MRRRRRRVTTGDKDYHTRFAHRVNAPAPVFPDGVHFPVKGGLGSSGDWPPRPPRVGFVRHRAATAGGPGCPNRGGAAARGHGTGLRARGPGARRDPGSGPSAGESGQAGRDLLSLRDTGCPNRCHPRSASGIERFLPQIEAASPGPFIASTLDGSSAAPELALEDADCPKIFETLWGHSRNAFCSFSTQK